MFKDRKDAGEKLAQALEKYKIENPLVLAIPRGGIEIGCQIAKILGLEFSIVVVRKLPLPQNPEAGFGALAEDGSEFVLPYAVDWLNRQQREEIKKEQNEEIQRRIKALRKGEPLVPLKNKTVILVDDGIAMGSTMRAAIKLCQNKGVGELIVASPVAGPSVADQINRQVDKTVILEIPKFFRAVAQSYQNWHDVSDQEVIESLNQLKGNFN
ncbi:MAG: phosphoribosyltransferase [Candidatus Omnitrophica bacterium]|nr:phosphoribosyltransferase [Candidatus Omnitrophota bacterium]MCF7892123.1 phosphoribosyltransferase [Candidatus Omnitrophota bacterium]MCF7896158.1 phosphoribosyltransferase [Candidatus Omnitrophota bacterium]MCF7897777.1 phosphoribosyltransferase [Candidatus Omnitrophota bacterium]MCF7909197.1 phosphoribosyltransferase [Candidatus Omnitrophota bacterium]